MFLVHVYPLSKGAAVEHLTYFSRVEPARGSFITVSLRNSKTPAVVVKTESALVAKSRVRSAGHALIKALPGEPSYLVHPQFLGAAVVYSRQGVAVPGSVLESVMPAAILKDPQKAAPENMPSPVIAGAEHETLLLQTSKEERFVVYKTLAREAIAKKESLLVVVATTLEADLLGRVIAKGIEEHVHVLHTDMSDKALIEAWKKIPELPHSVVVTTGACMGIPLAALTTVVVERESARAYTREYRPYVDIRTVAEAYAKNLGAKCIVGDTLLRVETRERLGTSAAEYAPLTQAAKTDAHVAIVDMRQYKRDSRGEYKALSRELLTMLATAHREGKHAFVLSHRKGLASSVVCNDCGTAQTCTRCASPFSLSLPKSMHNGAEVRRRLICRKCGYEESADRKCPVCSSWKLIALGAGSELIQEQLQREFQHMKVLRLDTDVTRSATKARAIVGEFLSTSGGILVGTEFALPFLPDKLPYMALTSIDSLLSVPEITIDERVFSLLLDLRDRTQIELLIQTRSPDSTTVMQGAAGDIAGFEVSEIARRKTLNFPPFSTLITVERSGNQKTVETSMQALLHSLMQFQPVMLPVIPGRQYTRRLLFKIPRERYPDVALLTKLKMLPPQFAVHVGTDTLFS